MFQLLAPFELKKEGKQTWLVLHVVQPLTLNY